MKKDPIVFVGVTSRDSHGAFIPVLTIHEHLGALCSFSIHPINDWVRGRAFVYERFAQDLAENLAAIANRHLARHPIFNTLEVSREERLAVLRTVIISAR